MGEDPPDEPSGERPACAREEADGAPHADLVEVDGGRHVKFSLYPSDATTGPRRRTCPLPPVPLLEPRSSFHYSRRFGQRFGSLP